MVTLQLRQLDVPPGQQLLIRNLYTLQAGHYQLVDISPTFPTLPILDFVASVLEQSIAIARSPALRAFRKKIQTLNT